MNIVSNPTAHKGLLVRWKTSRGLAAIIVFLIIAVLLEFVVVVYAMSLGVKDESVVQYSFKFPGTGWTVTLGISLLFHLVPITVVIALVSSWIYLTKRSAVRLREPAKTGSGVKRAKQSEIKSIMTRLRSELLQASIRSAMIVLFMFMAFTFIASLLAYPQLIFRTIANAYANNPSLLSFIKGSGRIFAPLASFVNGAVPTIGPGFRDFAAGLGSSLAPLANLDNAGKYLVFQNVAAWVSALTALTYGEFSRRGYRRRKRKS